MYAILVEYMAEWRIAGGTCDSDLIGPTYYGQVVNPHLFWFLETACECG